MYKVARVHKAFTPGYGIEQMSCVFDGDLNDFSANQPSILQGLGRSDPSGEDAGAGGHSPFGQRGHAGQEGVPVGFGQPLLQDLRPLLHLAQLLAVALDFLLDVG